LDRPRRRRVVCRRGPVHGMARDHPTCWPLTESTLFRLCSEWCMVLWQGRGDTLR
jgi:hypothetical protein